MLFQELHVFLLPFLVQRRETLLLLSHNRLSVETTTGKTYYRQSAHLITSPQYKNNWIICLNTARSINMIQWKTEHYNGVPAISLDSSLFLKVVKGVLNLYTLFINRVLHILEITSFFMHWPNIWDALSDYQKFRHTEIYLPLDVFLVLLGKWKPFADT